MSPTQAITKIIHKLNNYSGNYQVSIFKSTEDIVSH